MKLFFAWVILIIIPLFAWITHIFVSIANNQWGMLIVGILAFPIGILHGIMIWLGFA